MYFLLNFIFQLLFNYSTNIYYLLKHFCTTGLLVYKVLVFRETELQIEMIPTMIMTEFSTMKTLTIMETERKMNYK